MRNIEPKKRAFDIPEHCSAFPNLSLLWCQHFFPLYPLATVAFPLIPTRDTNIQGYGRISQKLRLLKNLEQCHSRLLKKITTKLKHLLNQSLSEGTSPDHRFLLEHCQGFLMPPSPSGSSQEGSLRKLREEVRIVEELTEDSYRKQQYLEKYFEWVGVDASPSPEFSFDSSTRSFSEELIQSAGMVASIESILPLLLVNKKYTFPPPSNEENQKRSIKVSTDVCLRHLCLAAIQNLERMSPTKCGLDGLDSEVTILPHIACRAIVDPNLELSLSSFLCLPPQPSEEIERALHHLRQSNNEVIQKTIAATKKYSLFEFDTLRKI